MTQLTLFSTPQKKETEANLDKPKESHWSELSFLCVDTETTGLDAENNRVIEVAWLHFKKQKEVSTGSKLCSIGIPLPPIITNITGITDQMLETEKSFSHHATSLIEAIEEVSFVVAYNAPFDKKFLDSEMARIGKALPDRPWIDPCVFIKQIDRYKKGKKLVDATARWGVQLEQAHRALADARATGLLLYKLADALKCHSLEQLMKKQNGWQTEQKQSYNQYLAKKKAESKPPF